MHQGNDFGSRQTIRTALGAAAAVLFCAAAMIYPKSADAAHDGRGFHGNGGVHGGGSHPGSRHFRGGFVGVYAPYWGVTAFPTTITAFTATTPITGITATILAPATTATILIAQRSRFVRDPNADTRCWTRVWRMKIG